MTRSWRDAVKRDQLPDNVKERFLAILASDERFRLGNEATLVKAFADCGEFVYRSEVKHLLDGDLRSEAREARGWNPDQVTDTLYDIAKDKNHPQAVRAGGMLLQAHGGPEWRAKSSLELSGPDGQPVVFEDRSASLDDVARVLTSTGALDDSSVDAGRPVAAPGVPVAAPRDV